MTATTTTPDVDVTKTGDTVQGRFAFTLPTLPSVTLPNVTLPNVTLPNVTIPAVNLDEVRKPAFAVAGLADLWIEQVKDVPATVTAEAEKVQARLADVPNVVKTLPARVEDLREDLEARVAKAQESATDLYAKLAVRGERLVTSIRRQPATEAAIAEGKEAVKKAEQATVAARKSAKAGEKAVEDAAAKIG